MSRQRHMGAAWVRRAAARNVQSWAAPRARLLADPPQHDQRAVYTRVRECGLALALLDDGEKPHMSASPRSRLTRGSL